MDTVKKKTDEMSVAEMLEQSLREAIEIKEGRAEPARQVFVTADMTEIEAPPRYSASHIRRIREGLCVSQSVFAGLLAVSGSTVAAWEQGERTPNAASRRLLEVAEESPNVLLSRLRV